MTPRPCHILFLLVVLSISAVGQVARPSSIGGTAGAPFRMGFGARGMGLGNAMCAVNVGDLSSYYNPALVPFQQRPFAFAAYSVLTLDRRLNYLAYAQSLKPTAGISFGIINSGVSNIQGRDRDGEPTEIYSTSENSFFFSFGLMLDEEIAVGVSAKLLYYSLFEELSSSTLGLDIGVLYRLTEEIAIAIVTQDINSKYIWDTSKLYGRSGNATTDKFPLRKKFGVSYSPSASGLVVAAEAEFISSETFLRLGSEMNIAQGFALRAGVDQIGVSQSVGAKPTLGMSFQVHDVTWNPGIHYAFVFEPYVASGIHIISFSASFE
ncbi:MAG: hypothetical protein HY562_04545 [Ignavibacteriales bacterium]|nr:hypothetical protein [Ignavibacteriales bacterium]